MAPTRPKKNKKANGNKKKSPPLDVILQEATSILHSGDAPKALLVARKVLERTGEGGDFELPALNLLGLASIELGEADDARGYLLRAAERDPDGVADEKVGGGPEKFLWLAQLSEDGGADSVRWFEKGAAALRTQIDQFSSRGPTEQATEAAAEAAEAALDEKRRELAGVLCAVAEVYMTDLSWEADAETRCEALITEATMTCPDSAETWQTVASVRISQQRTEDARTALRRSLDVWRDLDPGDGRVPDFAVRVSLARLLMEVDMTAEAAAVLDRLVADDDQSVEAWYLGGWCRFIEGEKLKGKKNGSGKGQGSDGGKNKGRGSGSAAATTTTTTTTDGKNGTEEEPPETWTEAWAVAREWLVLCLKLYKMQDYEDERLGEHAHELIDAVNGELGELPEDGDDEEDEGGWEDADDSDGGDEAMAT